MRTLSIKMTCGTVCGGEIVKKDSIVEASEPDARQLVGAGQAVLVGEDEAPNDYSGESLEDSIMLAIAELDTDNPDHFTADNIPRVEAIENILDMDITSEQRDAAWSTLVEDMG